MNSVILWFRRDLRLQDNPALLWAMQEGYSIVALYIDSREEEGMWAPGAASRWWLHHSLHALSAELDMQGVRLHFYKGGAAEILEQVMEETGITTVVANTLHEPNLYVRDQRVAKQLEKSGRTLRLFDEENFLHPQAMLNKQGSPYKIFTPFWKRLRSELKTIDTLTAVGQDKVVLRAASLQPLNGASLDGLVLLDENQWHEKLHHYWSPGEESAWHRVDAILESIVTDYPLARDIPARDGTSKLSPHLHFGELSARQLLRVLLPLLDGPAAFASGAEVWLRQLGWREFSRYILWHFPYTAEQSMDPRFNDSFWQMDEALFSAWKGGQTGEPIIDAGMYQLWQSGWMHNRVRMLTASYLTKNLGLPWQAGARWFWETLVDADLANNSMGWQWVAGCGVDAAPYFRIFNPRTQAERFDPQGHYCKHWSSPMRKTEPLVDLKWSREQALERYQVEIKHRRTV